VRLRIGKAYERGHHLYYSALGAARHGAGVPNGVPAFVWMRAREDAHGGPLPTVSLSEMMKRLVGPELEPLPDGYMARMFAFLEGEP
jgi:hypothetical protein